MRFVDTNILLYAVSRDPDEGPKAEIATELLMNRDLGLSAQVLQEFYVQATRATREDALSHRQAADLVAAYSRFPVQETTLELVQVAIAARDRFALSYWDAAIIEAARMLRCDHILSEDLSDTRDYDGIAVIDPFRT